MAINDTSFTKTPQAGDDNYNWTEDELLASGLLSGNIVTLDVMSNDLGGNAKKLYSIDDGNGHTDWADYDLKSADTQGMFENAELNNLGVHDQIAISGGKIQLDISHSLAQIGATNVDALAAGDEIHDTFVYAIRLANGTLSQATVKVDIYGSNDGPVITSNGGGDTAAVTINENTTAVTTVQASDVDHGATQIYSIVGGADQLLFNIDSSTG